MNYKTFKPFLMLAVAAFVITLWSCSKDETIATVVGEELQADEILAKQPSPGVYAITKFIDTGDDETAQFNGYTFKFKANGGLTVTTANGTVFNGSWDLNGAETVMTINIAGNEALDDLDDDDWQVVAITNQRIKIKANGPDIVVFNRI